MKQTRNITLSFPTHVISRMHKFVGKGQISKFTTEAVMKALDEVEKMGERELEIAYEAASKDAAREAEADAWSLVDHHDIEGWEWEDEK